ncbi:MAG TPA: formimidoylglutamate deiminase [Acidobacteriaceae bacterium]|nr:formimidoylglutamate deiminase [Acidobacteriaceae bacterium]
MSFANFGAPMMTLFQPDTLYSSGRMHAGAGLLVDAQGNIVRVTTAEESARSSSIAADTEVVTLRGKALLPGFVNAHSHAFQRLIRGRTESKRIGGRDFWSWRAAMYHAAASLSPEQMFAVARAAFLEMVLAGTTTVGEFHYVHRTPDGKAYPNPNVMAQQIFAAAESVGIRICLLRAAYQRAGFELPEDPGQVRFLETTDEFLANVAELHREYDSSDAWVGVAPHSVRAVPLEAIESMAAWAREHHRRLHIHVSEQMAEIEECQREYGTTPVRLLERNGLLRDHFTAVHATHIDREEMDLLAANRAAICACPTTERNLGDGIFAARDVMERGIPVCLGSDSQAQIEPLEDARELEYHLRLQQQQRSLLDGIDGQELSARLFRCATANGAHALGCDAGDFEPGKLADLFTVNLNDISIAGNLGEDLLPTIVFGMRTAAVADVCVGGRFVVSDHRHPQQQEILNQYQEVARKVWSAPQLATK